ncbi:hypothetical protein AAVH_07365 [Aphelenchoides avenae]|nr:hypothetical protein AAVH_07365 [Aphelenchus avenae]
MRSEVAKCDLEWTLRMLNGLHSNCRIDDLSVRATAYRSDINSVQIMSEQYRDHVDLFRLALDTRKVKTLELTISDPYFKDLIENRRFLEWPSMMRLESLSLEIRYSDKDLQPYYMSALYQLESCKHMSIEYEYECDEWVPGGSDLTKIADALRKVLREFETTGRELAVERFELILPDRITTFVDRENMALRDVYIGEMSGYVRGKVYYYHNQSDRNKVLTVFIHGRHLDREEKSCIIELICGKYTEFTAE